MARRSSGRFFYRLLIVLVVGILGFLALSAFRSGPAPEILVQPLMPGIGKRTPVRVVVEEPKRGLTRYSVEFVQGDRVSVLAEREFAPLEPWEFWGERTARDELTVDIGTETLDGLNEGKASIIVRADRAGAWLRFPGPVTEEIQLPVKLRPPNLHVTSNRTYVAQGGCEAVVYRVGESSVEDGVQVGDWWFPGYPLPGGGERERFALFGVPFDTEDDSAIRLVARDDVGNEARAAFVNRFIPRPFKTDTIRLSKEFMERVVPAIMAQTPELRDRGGLLENYLMLNNDLRRQNTKTLIELSQESEPEFLWNRVFLGMKNAKVMSNFADRRNYLYEGQKVDQQDHLGFDLASTRMADIESSNDGLVVMARYFGIYGNAVLIDHGYGLMTLYGHLSTIAVEEGERVERGQVIGRSGATGLAGGDHLHITVLLRGLSVNPQEWWDEHWIHDRLELKLGPALPFE